MTRIEQELDRDLSQLQERISEMAALAGKALTTGLQAFQQLSRALAYQVILRDQRIDAHEKELDQLALHTLVRQQPAGTHLRLVYGAIKVNADLERIGDYAESIAKQIIKLADLNLEVSPSLFDQIANLSIPMLKDAVTAFVQQDANLARQTMRAEEEADEIRNQIYARLLQLHRDGHLTLEALWPLMTIARRFERVTDQAKNICEETLYVCTGKYSKHLGSTLWRILFVDQSGACLAPMAAAIGCSLGLDRLDFASAGLDPKPLDPFTQQFLQNKQQPPAEATPQDVAACLAQQAWQVMVLLGPGVRITTPAGPTKTITLAWAVHDPSSTTGTASTALQAYESVYDDLSRRITELVNAILGDEPLTPVPNDPAP